MVESYEKFNNPRHVKGFVALNLISKINNMTKYVDNEDGPNLQWNQTKKKQIYI